MFRALSLLKVAAFGFASLLILAAGFFGAQRLWYRTHDRHELPNTGVYYGYVGGYFDDPEASRFGLSFHGASPQRWYWGFPTNFAYRNLELEWQSRFARGRAILQLPSFELFSDEASGILTRDILEEWLVGPTNEATSAQIQGADAIYEQLLAAAAGRLPPPRTQGYEISGPANGHIQHAQMGYGVSSFAYLWCALWLVSNGVVAWRFVRKTG